jgi:hypothetical protein
MQREFESPKVLVYCCVAQKVVKQPVNVYPVSSVLDSGCDRPRGILPSSHSFYIFFYTSFFQFYLSISV